MLAVSPLTSCSNNEQRETEMEVGFSMDFPGLANFDAIDLDDLFMGMDDAGHDLLPDLEMDPEIDLAEFSVSAASCQDQSEVMTMNLSSSSLASVSASDLGSGSPSLTTQAEETASNDKEPPEKQKGRKLSFKSKNPSGRKKVKVDWTPELHKRFVQAVEQLGVDKAVPSRILEIMGITCLTRHNIASHLQKYRSHQKHRMAREAEVASWSQSQGREVYRAKPSGQVPWMRDINPWIAAPTVGFPPVTPMTHYRPLHVWGHPSLMHMWPPPPNASSPVQPHTLEPPLAHPSIWHSQSHHHRFPSIQLVPGVPTPQEMYKVDTNQFGPRVVPSGQILPQPPSDAHPSKESVDAAIGDVLSKPWLPLPLGLKPPSTDSVMVALQRQGISKIPPTCARLS